jgi:hypothetical protein
MTIPDDVDLKPLKLAYRRSLETFGKVGQRNPRILQQSLMGDSGGSSEDQNADRNVDSKDCAYEGSDGDKDSFGKVNRSNLCYFVAKNLSAFPLCIDTL